VEPYVMHTTFDVIRTPSARSRGNCPILFHPDYYRRPRSCTGSADPLHPERRSRAFCRNRLPPVGTSTPPWEQVWAPYAWSLCMSMAMVRRLGRAAHPCRCRARFDTQRGRTTPALKSPPSSSGCITLPSLGAVFFGGSLSGGGRRRALRCFTLSGVRSQC